MVSPAWALAAPSARAQGDSPPSAPGAPSAPAAPIAPIAPAPRIVEVRLGLSASAAESLAEPRLRRLLEIELDENLQLAPGTAGPLGDNVAYLWIDVLSASAVLIEVRVGERPVARRQIAIAGLSWDVAARIAVITASEMLRTQLRPVRAPRRAPAPKGPTPEELEIASRSHDALTWSAAGSFGFVPSTGAALAGPSIALGYRRFGVTERLFASWLVGPTDTGPVRWFEAGLGADYRIWLAPSWRLSLGASAAFALARFTVERAEGVEGGAHDAWSARAGGAFGVESRIHGPVWLALTLEPGFILHPVSTEGASEAKNALQGAWLGANLSLSVEWLRPSTPVPAR